MLYASQTEAYYLPIEWLLIADYMPPSSGDDCTAQSGAYPKINTRSHRYSSCGPETIYFHNVSPLVITYPPVSIKAGNSATLLAPVPIRVDTEKYAAKKNSQ